MKYSFKNGLLTTSCLAISLSLSTPGFSMQEDEEKKNIFSTIQLNNSMGIEFVEVEEPFFKLTDFGNRKFNIINWFSLFWKQPNEKQLYKVLKDFAFNEGDSDALKTLYTFSTNNQNTLLNEFNEKEGEEAFKLGVKLGQEWAFNECIHKINSTKDENEFKKLHLLLANRGYRGANSEEFLDKCYPFNAQKWLEGYVLNKHQETIEQLIERLKKTGYYKHFSSLYHINASKGGHKGKLFMEAKPKFINEVIELGHKEELESLFKFYSEESNYIKQNSTMARMCIQKLAEMGLNYGMYDLGLFYKKGQGGEKDPEQAYVWFTKAADKGWEDAIIDVITQYWYHDPLKKDYKKVILETNKFIEKDTTSPKNRATAYLQLGLCYQFGDGVEKNLQTAYDFFKQAAHLNNQNALIKMALAYQKGETLEKNIEEAIAYWRKVAENDPKQWNELGCLYERRNQEGDLKQAYNCFVKSANYGNCHAMHNLGFLYLKGLSVTKNLETAIGWFEKAAKAGHVGAQLIMGEIYLYGSKAVDHYFKNAPIKINKKLAEQWLTKAANNGSTEAMVSLGLLCCDRKNDKKGFDLYKKAANLGNEYALYNCGLLLLNGRVSENTNTDDELALSYFHKAADKNFSPAMVQLARYYLERSEENNEEGQQNLETAFFWIEKARELKDPEAEILFQEAHKKKKEELSKEFLNCLQKIEEGAVINKEEVVIKENVSLHVVLEEVNEVDSSDQETELPPQDQMNVEQEEAFDTPITSIPRNKELIKNSKRMRELLKKAGEALKNKKENTENQEETLSLSKPSEEIIHMLKNKKQRGNITYDKLCKLFSDPYFKAKGRVEIQKTKSGVSIIATHHKDMKSCLAETGLEGETKEVITTGTHNNHNKTYKGYNLEFLKNVIKILDMFGVTHPYGPF